MGIFLQAHIRVLKALKDYSAIVNLTEDASGFGSHLMLRITSFY